MDGLGTLLELQEPWLALMATLAEDGIEIDQPCAERAFRAEIAYYVAHHLEGFDDESLEGLRARCAQVLHSELPSTVSQALSSERTLEVMLSCLRFTVFGDVRPTLCALRQRGETLIVVSNWDVSLHRLLDSLELSPLLDSIITSAEAGKPKPSGEIFQAALEQAGVHPGQALHVGDSLANDVMGALAAGITPVLLRRNGAIEGSPSGVRVIHSLAELLA